MNMTTTGPKGLGRGGAGTDQPRKPAKQKYNNIGNQLEYARLNNDAKREHAEMRKKETTKQFYENWKQQKRAQIEAEKIILRDPKAKLVVFEMISIHKFAIQLNFHNQEEIVSILKVILLNIIASEIRWAV